MLLMSTSFRTKFFQHQYRYGHRHSATMTNIVNPTVRASAADAAAAVTTAATRIRTMSTTDDTQGGGRGGSGNDRGNDNDNDNDNDNMDKVIQSMRKEFYKHQSLSQSQSIDIDVNDNNRKHKHNPWDTLWEKELTPWDIGSATPVLKSELKRIRIQSSSSCSSSSSLSSKSPAFPNPMSMPPHKSSSSLRLRSLIPGCGGGYDLLTVAKHHQEVLSSTTSSLFVSTSPSPTPPPPLSSIPISNPIESTVVGLDISPTSLKRATDNIQSLMLVEDEEEKKEEEEGMNKVNSSSHTFFVATAIDIDLKCGDFFASESDWSNVYNTKYSVGGRSAATNNNHNNNQNNNNNNNNHKTDNMDSVVESSIETGGNEKQKFDFIFDYTFFCALPVELRPKWGKRISELLRPESGRLLTLIFPIPPNANDSDNNDSNDNGNDTGNGNDNDALVPPLEGPPFPVTVREYRKVLEPHGFRMVEGSPFEHEDTIKPRKGKELVCWWKLVDAKERISMSML